MIKPLSESAISQIATSVALQTLSSFVKELIENSIDAGSTLIVITFYESGRQGVQVSDNGQGISFDQCQNLAVKGGTSKLENWEDLSVNYKNVQTHGFRGEALNAISQLGELTIISRYREESQGWRAIYSDQAVMTEVVERENGTTVKVTNLFRSLPVRRLDFERNFKQQYNNSINLITEYAIIQEGIEFRVSNIEGQSSRQVLISGQPCDMQQKIRNVLGDRVMQNLQPVEVLVDESNSVKGFVSKTVDSGSVSQKKSLWYTYLNKRPINAPKSLLALITRIYRQYNPKGHFMFILNFMVKEADFNVSVDKRDVYFKNEERIGELLQNEIVSKLESVKEIGKTIYEERKSDPRKSNNQISITQPQPPVIHQQKTIKETVPQVKKPSGGSSFLSQLQRSMNSKPAKKELEQQQPENQVYNTLEQSCNFVETSVEKQQIKQEDSQFKIEIQQDEKFKINSENSLPIQNPDYQIENDQMILPSAIPFKKRNFKDLHVIGQFNKGFLVTFWEAGKQILVLDQHACDEKSTFEMLLQKCKINSTALLVPFKIELKQNQIELLQYRKQEIEQLGMHFEIDENIIILKTLPSYGKTTFGVETFNILIEQLCDDPSGQIQLPGLKNIIATQACRSSIMVGQELSEEKMKQMCDRMDELESPWNCPHGRPTFVRLEQSNQLERVKRGFSRTK